LGLETDSREFVSVMEVLRQLVRNPAGLLIRRWNWKSALLSSLFRAAIFFVANWAAGWRAAFAAMSVELLYRGISAGFFGALTQAFRRAQPTGLAAVATLILVPLVSHSLEFTVHLARGTPKLIASMISSVVFTVLSTLFHLYAMRRGVLIVGSEGRSFAADFRAIPRIVGGFLAVAPIALRRLSKLEFTPRARTIRY
jgi:ABC-type amino acid transport system permease subunit